MTAKLWCSLAGAWLLVQLVPPTVLAGQACPEPRVITYHELRDAMGRRRGNYDQLPTPNWGRFQTDVYLNLMHDALARDSQGGVILITAEDWYQAYKDVAKLKPEEVHIGQQLAREVGQNMLLDFRRGGVVRHLDGGRKLRLAANARISWTGGRSKYSYRDTLTEPRLQVTSHREITHRILEFDDGMVFYDEIRGVSGRPTSGFAALLLSLIGEGGLQESRLAVAGDDILVVRARAKKIFAMNVTAVVHPEGRGEEGIPPGRADLAALERLLLQPVEVKYLPVRC